MSLRHQYLIPVISVVFLAGCSAAPQQSAPPPAIVETLTITAQTIPNTVDLPGRIEAVRTAEVRARTDGIVERRLYEEGTDVRAGEPLFQIDSRDYRAQVQQAGATLQQALAARNNAAAVVRRYTPLASQRAVSGQEFDSARSDLAQAEARVADARAALTRAELTLSYTTVRAPIAGRVGRAEITEGALVSGSQATLLTRVDQMAPIYAVFTASSSSILDTAQQIEQGNLRLGSLASVTVELVLENGEAYGPKGRVDFASASVDPQTGSQTLRARFANPNMLLKPGQFVRGHVNAGTINNGIVVPTRAVQIKDSQASVSIFGPDGMVSLRPVTLGQMLGNRWVIRSGLKPGERIIVEGWQKVRPGQKAVARAPVQPAPARPAPTTSGR